MSKEIEALRTWSKDVDLCRSVKWADLLLTKTLIADALEALEKQVAQSREGGASPWVPQVGDRVTGENVTVRYDSGTIMQAQCAESYDFVSRPKVCQTPGPHGPISDKYCGPCWNSRERIAKELHNAWNVSTGLKSSWNGLMEHLKSGYLAEADTVLKLHHEALVKADNATVRAEKAEAEVEELRKQLSGVSIDFAKESKDHKATKRQLARAWREAGIPNSGPATGCAPCRCGGFRQPGDPWCGRNDCKGGTVWEWLKELRDE